MIQGKISYGDEDLVKPMLCTKDAPSLERSTWRGKVSSEDSRVQAPFKDMAMI